MDKPAAPHAELGVVVERVRGREVLFLRLSGRIDERFEQDQVGPIDAPAAIDLSGIRAITSYGVRRLGALMGQVGRAGPVYLVDCPPCIVDQLNLIQGFMGTAEVLSAKAFFACACGNEEERSVDVLGEGARIRSGQPPIARCGRCGDDMRLVEDDSFRFVAQCGARRLDPRVRSALLELGLYASTALEERPLAVHKVVDGADVALRIEGTIGARTRLDRVVEDEGIVALLLGGLIVRAEGAEPFARFLGTLDGRTRELVLVDVPPQLAGLFAHGGLHFGKAKLASLLAPVRCRECAELALTTTNLHEANEVPRCPRCGHPAELVGAPLDRERLRATGPPSAEARALLERVEGLFSQAAIEARLVSRPKDDPTSELPTQLGGYRILRPLSAGGMAEVLLATRQSLGGVEKLVALKRFRRQLFQSAPASIAMFLAEARLAAQLSHPNIAQIFDVGETDGDLYMAMEFVDGRDLREVVDTGRPVPPQLVAHIGVEVARALAYLHDARDLRGRALKIVHRDVSPQNILVDKSGRVVLIDFGVALAGEGELQKRRRKVAGNLAYMSPEQCYGEPLDGRSDLFSLGVTMWELLMGEALFRREETADTREALLRGEIPPLKDVPPSLDALAMRLLSREREERPTSAGEVARDLDAILPQLGGRVSAAALGTFVAEALDPHQPARLDSQRAETVLSPVPPARPLPWLVVAIVVFGAALYLLLR
jgi:tRNA A-37 threonylcarbamoyl transferase component Bud32